MGTSADAVLTVTFRRRPGARDEVEAVRSDGSRVTWDFPTYGDVLPHDLVHVVVEEEFGLTDGFWGLLDGGAEVRISGDQAVLVRGGIALSQIPGVDLSGLVQAEEAVALLGPRPRLEQAGLLAVARLDSGSFGPRRAAGSAPRPEAQGENGLGFRLPETASASAVAQVRHRLAELARRWRDLGDGEITLTWRPVAR